MAANNGKHLKQIPGWAQCTWRRWSLSLIHSVIPAPATCQFWTRHASRGPGCFPVVWTLLGLTHASSQGLDGLWVQLGKGITLTLCSLILPFLCVCVCLSLSLCVCFSPPPSFLFFIHHYFLVVCGLDSVGPLVWSLPGCRTRPARPPRKPPKPASQ